MSEYKEKFLKEWEEHKEYERFTQTPAYKDALYWYESEKMKAVTESLKKYKTMQEQAIFADEHGYDWTKIVDAAEMRDYKLHGMKVQGDYYLYHARENTQGDGVLWLLVATPFIILLGGGVVAGISWAVIIWFYYIVVVCTRRNEKLEVTPHVRLLRIQQFFTWCRSQEKRRVEKEWEEKKDELIRRRMESERDGRI